MSQLGQPFDPRQRFGKDEQFASDLVWKDRSIGLSPGEKSAYWKLLCFGQKSGVTFVRDETVAAEIGIGGRQFRFHKTRLKEVGLIDWKRAEHKRCSEYTFLLHPVLTGTPTSSGSGYSTGTPASRSTGTRTSTATGTPTSGVKKESEAIANESVPTSSVRASANASSEEEIYCGYTKSEIALLDEQERRSELVRWAFGMEGRDEMFDWQFDVVKCDLLNRIDEGGAYALEDLLVEVAVDVPEGWSPIWSEAPRAAVESARPHY
jgi:hypothetical protein